MMHLRKAKGWIRETLVGGTMPDIVVLLSRYWFVHRRVPRLVRPRRFTEKMLLRMMFDRRPELPVLADKSRVRDYVASRIGEEYLPRMYHLTADPQTIPFDLLPDRFVVKPTHGSQWVRVVTDKANLDRAELIATCNGWLGENYHGVTREWGYRHVTPRILVEELIDDGNRITPHDYKCFVYNGRVEFIHVVMSRFIKKSHLVVTPDWVAVDVSWPTCGERVQTPPPPHLQQMLEAATRLSEGFDFMRVDFYDTAERLVLGELTATAGAASEHFKPDSFDHVLGKPWKLDVARLLRDRMTGRSGQTA